MIKKLRRRFIAVAMASVAAVLVVILAAANISGYLSASRGADMVLDYLADNGGSFPRPFPKPEIAKPDGGVWSAGGERRFTEETPYDTRYFTALVADGEVRRVNTGSIASVSSEDAELYAFKALSEGRSRGYLGDYRYLVTETEEGALLIFMDNSRDLQTFRSFLLSSVKVSFLVLAAVLLMTVFLSRRAVAPVAESYEKQKRFITDAGHELKTPLAVISANAEVLEIEQGESQWTRSIKNQVERLSVLTGELITLTRMDEDAHPAAAEDVDLTALITECCESFLAPAARLGCTVELDAAPDVVCRGESESLRRVAVILIDNACKYCASGGRVEVRLFAQGRNAVLRVQNDCDGIERGAHPEYFRRFYRGDPSRSERGGYGLGLSIAEAIVEKHKGTITAESTDGKSLTVTATLPKRK